MAEAPTVRRRQLAKKLLALRLAAGLDQEDVARVLECDDSKISRIETGRSGVRPMDLRALLALYGMTDGAEIEEMVQAARQSRRRGWWVQYSLGKSFASFVALEEEASRIRAFENQLVPGLLQTEAYARAVYKETGRVTDPRQVDAFVKVRQKRQAIVARRGSSGHEGDVELWFIVGEAVLRHEIGEPHVRIEQLQRLIEVSELPRVELQVLPIASGLYAAVGGSFNLLSFQAGEADVAYEDTGTSGIFVEDAEQVAHYDRAFRRLTAGAMPVLESRRFIESIVKELRT
ncbi:helix-turn-helix domain-containing protein [Embleya sp. MST-111070]|uniref:helix-turn-helix domain-containing protein n=1 Tax=Embleya sp. MST-111070 TaxID=3398231 RepID=UPI003F740879